jgi:hypothetical protein
MLLLLQFLDVFCVQPICNRHKDFVPAVIAGLVSPNQQHRIAVRVEGIKDTIGPSFMLNPQFSHVAVLAPETLLLLRGGQRNAVLFKKQHYGVDTRLLFHGQSVPPTFELIAEEHVNHQLIIARREYSIKGILCALRQLSAPSNRSKSTSPSGRTTLKTSRFPHVQPFPATP